MCEYCNPDVENDFLLDEDIDLGKMGKMNVMIDIVNGHMCVGVSQELQPPMLQTRIIINHCPMCGRAL